MIHDVYSGSLIPDLDFFHPGFRFQGSKNTGSRIRFGNKKLQVFLTQKVDTKLSEL
jgi:hypothetical protein